MRAILYARVSTRGQAERGYSLRQQIEALHTYAESKGYDVLAEHTDDGYSGMTLDRPGLDRVRELVEVGGVDLVLAQDQDRFAREPAFHYLLETEFSKYGTKLAAINDWGGDTAEGQLLRGIQDQVAKYERVLITERTRRGKLRRAREGKVVPAGSPPHGFTYDKALGNYRVHERTMRVVRRMFEMAASGTSLHRIRKTFEDEAIPTAAGSRFWNVNTIGKIIRNDVYRAHSYQEVKTLVSPEVAARLDPGKRYGISWYNRRSSYGPSSKRLRGAQKPRENWIAVPVPNAGIPREWVDAARENLEGNSRASRADNRFWELSEFVFCSCGCKLVSRVTHKAGRRYHYYVCSRFTRDGRAACPGGKWLNAERFEHEVYTALLNIQPQDVEVQIQQLIDKERAPEAEINAAHEVLQNVAQERDKLVRLYTTGRLNDEQFDVHASELKTREEAAQRELERLQTSNERIERLRWIKSNPILTVLFTGAGETAEAMRRGYYRDLGLRILADRDGVKMNGSQIVAPTSTSGTER
jgi:site-specific DNA recombinase